MKKLWVIRLDRILRWGTFIIFIIFILFIFFAWFIKYPDLIPSPVEITTENPPVTLVSKINGRIKHLDITNKSKVLKGQVLAVMETAASYNEFEILKQFTDTASHILSMQNNSVHELTELGELQLYYSTFQKNLSDYNNYIKNDYYGNKIQSVKDEIIGTNIYINRLKESEKLYSENLELDAKRFRRDSALFIADKTIPASEYDKSRQALIRQRLDLQEIRLQLSAKNIEQTTRQQLLKEYSINRSKEIEKLSSTLQESFRNLKLRSAYGKLPICWYLPSPELSLSPNTGVRINLYNIDEPVLTIVPADQGSYVGRINLKMERSGKVQIGQRVNIKLSSFPYLEYGMVRGIIKTKSLVPSGDAYVIEIDLPEGLKTLYNRQLDFTQNMQGTAEIITDDMRLFQKIINPFRYLLSKNKR